VNSAPASGSFGLVTSIQSDESVIGTGTLGAASLVQNGGQFDPGGGTTVGSITVASKYAQMSAGTLNLYLDGLSDFDQLNVSRNATLGGTLNVSWGPDYTPHVGDSFTIITDALQSGTFSTCTGLTDGSVHFAIEYTPTNVTLVAYSSSNSAPTVTGVSLATGTTKGNNDVVITGTTFTNADAVTFGGTAALGFTVNSTTQITAVVPPESSGTVDVQVQTPAGTSATGSGDHYTYYSAPVPVVTGVTASSGATAANTVVTITGTGFTGTTYVMFGDVAVVDFLSTSDTSIVVAAPAESAGTVDVEVTTPNGTSAPVAADHYTYTTPAGPAVTGISVGSGATSGGTVITISGSGFTGATAVTFAASTFLSEPAAGFTVNGDTSITAWSPADPQGTVDILVTTPYGTSQPTGADRFTYTLASVPSISSISASSGLTTGGTVVRITGTNLGGTTSVMFGTLSARFTIVSPTAINALAPPEAAGTVDIQVVTQSGSSATSSSDEYTYVDPAPTVSAVAPASGATGGGTLVTISGSGFTGAPGVDFGAVPASAFTVVSDQTIVATAPPAAAGLVDITIATFDGTSSTSSSDEYTFSTITPSVTGVTPSSGTTLGGAAVTITGSGFTGASAVSFGTLAAAYTVINDGTIAAIAPASSATGTLDITVTAPGGTSSTGSSDEFTYDAASAPSISSLSSSALGTAGGTTLIITGSGFTDASGVSFGGIAAGDFAVSDDATITVTVPPEPAGVWDVTVSSPAGTSALVSADRVTVTAVSAPAVSGLDTSSGSTAGGTLVTVSGSGFTAAGAVMFGAVPATTFMVISDTSLVAIAPAQAAGTVDVTVAGPTGNSVVGSSDQFTYSAASGPTVTALSPTSANVNGGTVVTITGTNFSAAGAVSFGSVPATSFTVISSTTIVATQPPGTSTGNVYVTVTTGGGTSSTGSASQFDNTMGSMPSVAAVTPSSGPVGGGGLVTISGANFTGASLHTYSGGSVPFTVLSDSAVTFIAPFVRSTGTVYFILTTPSGTGNVTYTYNALTQSAPTVTGLSATSGPTGGGTFVTVSGTNFTTATFVKFGMFYASSCTVISDTQLTAIAPFAMGAGTVDVTVVNGGGTSATSSADHFTYSAGAAVSVPTISSLGTTSGSTAGGTSVAITGTNFTNASTVTFGGIAAASFTVNSGTSITATSPPAPAATIDIQVTGPGGTSSTGSGDHFTFNAGSAPTVTSLSASSGYTSGGGSLTITGTNFTGVIGVTVGGVPAPSFTINSGTSITVTMPAQTAGTFDVQVTSYAGTSPLASGDQYTANAASAPAVSSIGTSSGSTAGGTSVAVTGSNFTGASAVTFNGVPAASFTVTSSTSITALSPPEAAGTGDIIVFTPSGSSPATSGDQFTFTSASAPTVTSVSPTSGTTAGGTSVTVTGTNFTGATGVSFGTAAAASFVVNSATSITAISPPEGSSTIDITVSTYGGTSSTSSSDHYTFNAASSPSVTVVTPSSGSAAGGTIVAISGSYFTGASAVDFGSTPALSFTVESDNSIIAVAPPLAAGTSDITVTTPSGTSSTGSADHFGASAVSQPSSVSVNGTVYTGGGAVVLITGSGFTSANAVTFGELPAASFTVLSDTLISAVVPPSPAGTIDVTVTNAGGTASLSGSDRLTITAANPPAVSSASPTSGSTGGGNTVTVSGSYFTGASAVNFGTLSAVSFTVVNDSTILAVAPPQAAGTYDISVVTPTGTSVVGTSDHYTYSAATAPSVSGVSPNSGTSAGGTAVTISGSYFTGASAVQFGAVAASSFTIVSDNQIVAVAPSEAAGTYDITVTTPTGTSSTGSADHFTVSSASAPSVSAVTASSGTSAGGTVVTVTGSYFTGASAVKFGSTAAAWFIVNSDSSITAISPAGTAGTVDITVTTPSGTSSTGSADHWTYSGSSAPTVTAVSPSSGGTGGGTAVTLTGTGFTSAAAVYFGGLPATAFSVISDTSLVAVAPPEAAATVDITVTNIGTSSTGSADHFTFNAASAPTVTGISPSSGTTAGQTPIMVTGTNFTGASAVTFGTVPAERFAVLSATSIVVGSPPQAAGTYDITVTTPSGTSSTSSADQFTVSAASSPTVTAVTPTSGSTGGGTVAYISGSYFNGATAVAFGATAATSFTVLSDTLIQATAPPHASGTIDITVTTYAATSSTGSADHFTYNSAGNPSVTQVTPTEGSTAGGVVVTVLGSGFTGASGVSFGGTAATSFTVVNDTTILATVPADSAGTIDITVTTPSGTSSTGSADHFTYATAPTVTGVSPNTGSIGGGTSVTVTGTNFFPTVWVYFGTKLATSVTYSSSTSITAVSPSESVGTVDITVQTEVGTSATSASDQFTFASPQYLAGPPKTTGHAPDLTMKQLHPVVVQAEKDLKAAGYNIAVLRGVTFNITALAAPLLGLTSGDTIWIDQNAEGYGWYTGLSNSAFPHHVAGREFQASASSPARGKVDLLTVVLHELGHVLGYADIDPALEADDWMTATLGTGIRRLPDLVSAENGLTFDPSAHDRAFASGAAHGGWSNISSCGR